MRRTLLAAACGLAVGVTAQVGHASPGYAAGFEAACKVCSGASQTSFGVIKAAIMMSEQKVGRAINDGPFLTPIPIGFPMLQSQISASGASQAEQIVAAIEGSTNELLSTLAQQQALRVALEEEQKNPPLPEMQAAADSQGGCQSLSYGAVLDRKPRSSLGWGYQYVTKGTFESDEGAPIGDSVAPPTEAPDDLEGVRAAITNINQRARQVTNNQFQELKTRATDAGANDPTVAQVLDPGILFSQSNRTLDIEPDEFGVSDDERADYLIQYLMADAPTHADALGASAVTPAALNAAVDSQIHNMEYGMAMAVVNELIELRRARSGATDADAFLAQAMGEDVPEVASDEEFWHGITHYRQRDMNWLGRTMIDDRYALAQQVQMESEHLALKYERWKAMRNNTLLMAQVVANLMENEKP